MRRRMLVLLPLFALGAVGIGVTALLVPSSSGAQPTTGGTTVITVAVPIPGGRNFEKVAFKTCTGIGSQTTPPTSQSAGLGASQPIRITCERAGVDGALWSWRQAVESGNDDARVDVRLSVYEGDFATGPAPIQSYLLENAYPTAIDDSATLGGPILEGVTLTADAVLLEP